ncbi:MAG: UDP-N-acetylglucosamine--N-acetylmuramyl-(pentapeptide) pyrophosphoryl-undecaprenol [Bacillota bacterium]
MIKKLVLTGGGTGGHIYPALAVAELARKRYPGLDIVYVGRKGAMEERILKSQPEINFFGLDVCGFNRRAPWTAGRAFYSFAMSYLKIRKFLKLYQPQIIIGTGGYVSAPTVWAGANLKLPTVVHEQNVIPGLTTRILARRASLVAVSFQGTKLKINATRKLKVTGNPRASLVKKAQPKRAMANLKLPDCKKPLVVLVAGSLGASGLRNVFIELLREGTVNKAWNVLYLTGKSHYEFVRKNVTVSSNVYLLPYYDQMPDLLALATVVVTRAGATTLAELTALGVPSILIPSPYVANNHQAYNAEVLVRNGAAQLLKEENLTPITLIDELTNILDNSERLEKMQQAAKSLGKITAGEQLLQEIEKLLN